MGSKQQRFNQHVRRLKIKIKRFERQGKNVEGLKRELGFCLGEFPRPEFKTGAIADARHKKRTG